MKLIQKTSRYYLGYTLLVLALGTGLFYFLIRIVLIDSVDEALHQEQAQIVKNLDYEKIIDSLEPSPNVMLRKVSLTKVYPERYSTIKIYDEEEKDFVHYRQLIKINQIGDQFYEIIIRQSLMEAEELLASLLPAVAGLFLFILAGVFVINTYISNEVWRPFYSLLEKLKKYDIVQTKIIPYQHTGITEFNELNLSVEKMTKKIYRDFLSQKEFNENSSHEMQTPLAIILNKLEILIQSKNLSKEDLKLIEAMFDAVKRLTLLNKGLLLLSKIENQQFSKTENVAIEKTLRAAVTNFNFQIEDKEISVHYNILEPCTLNVNAILADILITNLISNAVKHNVPGGRIYLELDQQHLKIENTGNPLRESPESMFERFKKNPESQNSIGLGLAIVKKICDLFNYKITYSCEDQIHSVNINF